MKLSSFCPFTPLSSSASDNHTKCNLQHYLHLFTFTNYIPLKLPRKICQKNVITQSWNLASSEIGFFPFCKRALCDPTELSSSSGSWGPLEPLRLLLETCLRLVCSGGLAEPVGMSGAPACLGSGL